MNIILTRRSVRNFKKEKLSEELIYKLLKASASAPSAKNQQPWEFIVINDINNKKEIAKVSEFSTFLTEAPTIICLVCKNENLSTPDMRMIDMSLCAQNLMLEARYLGIGSCFVGIYPRQERVDFLQNALNIPKTHTPFALIALGYPKDDEAFFDANREVETLIHKEKF